MTTEGPASMATEGPAAAGAAVDARADDAGADDGASTSGGDGTDGGDGGLSGSGVEEAYANADTDRKGTADGSDSTLEWILWMGCCSGPGNAKPPRSKTPVELPPK